MTTADVHEKLVQEIEEIMEVAEEGSLSRDRPLMELGLDSLKAIEIAALLEYRYDVIIPLESFVENALSVDDLLQQVSTSSA